MRNKYAKKLGIVLLLLVLVAAAFFGFLTVTEYKPKDTENLSVSGSASGQLKQGDTFTVMTWNVGYAGLGANADFFMDGGTAVRATDEEGVNQNLTAVMAEIEKENPDILLLQEVDENSKRTYHINEEKQITDAFSADYDSTYAYNFKSVFIPYPFPEMMGKVTSGILTMSEYPIEEATRIQLPIPFKWPVSTCNLKRCLAVNRIPLEGSDKELVIVNLHLEAYDNGEGKIAQTAQLREFLQQEYDAGNYVIAGGDFNQTFSNVDQSKYPVYENKWESGIIDVDDFSDDFTLVMDSTSPTCRSLDTVYEGADHENFQYYVIDGFIVSENVQIESLKTIDLDFTNSDHNPVKLTVTLQ